MGKIEKILEIIEEYGSIDGAHHKQWLLDQVVRVACGTSYESWVETFNQEDYEWDAGIAP